MNLSKRFVPFDGTQTVAAEIYHFISKSICSKHGAEQ